MQKLKYKLMLMLGLLANLSFAATLPPAQSKTDMVVTDQQIATKVGLQILNAGGNAIDAAVAIGYALEVVYPSCGNLGGGGFMLIRFADGSTRFLNFRETAPAKLTPKMFLDAQGNVDKHKAKYSYLAAGVPGTVMGLDTALKRYGTMTLPQVMAPAIKLARDGFILNRRNVELLTSRIKRFKPQKNIADIFFKHGGPKVGELLKQPQLTRTLELIASKGTKVFYQGEIAREIVKASDEHGGVISLQDLKNYKISEEQPINCNYLGYHIIAAPPPSSGGVTLCEMLNITSAYPLGFLGFHAAASTHYTIEAMRYAYADRNRYLGDPKFINNPIKRLLSAKHAATIRQKIQAYRAGDSRKIGFKITIHEGHETTNYAVVDKAGNAVDVTTTLNGYFGNHLIPGNTGFFLNNEMNDFTIKVGAPNLFQLVQGKANLLAPGKQPLSSMTPTIVTHNNKLFMVLGAAGGSTIITQVLEVLQNVIDYKMNLQQAVSASRFHMQWLPDVVFMEPYAFSNDTLALLELMGYRFRVDGPYHVKEWGALNAILRDSKTDLLMGATDPRIPYSLAKGNN